MRRFAPLLSVLGATLLMMAVAFADGRPSVFYDSHSYDVMGRNLIEVVREFPASTQFKMHPGAKWGDEPVATDRLVDSAVEGARSPYYGVLLHGAFRIGTLWLLAFIQSLAAAWVIYLAWRTLAPRAPLWSYLALSAGLVAGSSLPFFTAFAMPDVFAGIGGCGLALLLTQTDRLKRWETAGLWLLVTYSLAIHKSHLMTGLLLTAAGLSLLWLMRVKFQRIRVASRLAFAAMALAWLSGMVFGAVYKSRTSLDLRHPPFVMARVMADGPGREYLRSACAADPDAYGACRFKGNLSRYSTENFILWSNRPNLGMFNLSNFAGRVRLEREEPRFVVETLLYDPVGEAAAAFVNWGKQLADFQVDDPLRNPDAYLLGRYWPTTSLPRLIPNFRARAAVPAVVRGAFFDQQDLAWWHGIVLVGGLGFLAWRLSRRDVRAAFSRRGLTGQDEPGRIVATVALLILVVLFNAAVCGVLSGPFNRYEARLVWLAPLSAGLVACALPFPLASVAAAFRRAFQWANGLWDRLRLQPVFGRFLPPLNGHLMRFGLVGGLGFVVDGAVLQSMIFFFGLNPIAGRAVSFPVAVLATWLANRTFTFPDRIEQSKVREASTYVAVQLVGGAANFAVFSALVHNLALFADWPILALAFGAAAGLIINYLGSKHIVFGRRPAAS